MTRLSNHPPRKSKSVFARMVHDCPMKDTEPERSENVKCFFNVLATVHAAEPEAQPCLMERGDTHIGTMTLEECQDALRHILGASMILSHEV